MGRSFGGGAVETRHWTLEVGERVVPTEFAFVLQGDDHSRRFDDRD